MSQLLVFFAYLCKGRVHSVLVVNSFKVVLSTGSSYKCLEGLQRDIYSHHLVQNILSQTCQQLSVYNHLPPVLWRLLLHHYKQRNPYQTIDLGKRQDCTAIIHKVSQALLLSCFEQQIVQCPLLK